MELSIVYKVVPKKSIKIILNLQSEPHPAHNNLQVATPPSLQDVAPLVTMVPPVPQILQPASLPNLPVIHQQQQPQVIYLQPVQPTEFIVVSKKKVRKDAGLAFYQASRPSEKRGNEIRIYSKENYVM